MYLADMKANGSATTAGPGIERYMLHALAWLATLVQVQPSMAQLVMRRASLCLCAAAYHLSKAACVWLLSYVLGCLQVDLCFGWSCDNRP